MLLIGRILSSHGVEGNVKVISFFENPEDIFKYKIIAKNGDALELTKVGKTSRRDVFRVKFAHINSMEEAKKNSNFELFVETSELPEIAENEIYLEDLLGMAVSDGARKGIVVGLANYGAGDILEIEWDNAKLESIVYSNDFVKNVDKQNRTVIISAPNYI
jgi:16S rRNA processing protein RimM